MAWGFAQLEDYILIYSNWNGKAKMTRTLTFILGYSQAGSELTTGIALGPPSSPQAKPKRERGEGEKEACCRGQFGWLTSYRHLPALILYPSSWEIKKHWCRYSGSATEVIHLGWVIPYRFHLPGNSLVWWPGLERWCTIAVAKGLG